MGVAILLRQPLARLQLGRRSGELALCPLARLGERRAHALARLAMRLTAQLGGLGFGRRQDLRAAARPVLL